MKYQFEQTHSPTFDAIIVSTLIGLTLASIPSIFAYYYLVFKSDSTLDAVLGYAIIVTCSGLSMWFSIWVLYPLFKEMFNESNKEWPV